MAKIAESPGWTNAPTRWTKSSGMPNSSFHDDASTAPIPAPIAVPLIAPVAAAAPAAAAEMYGPNCQAFLFQSARKLLPRKKARQ